MTPRLTLICCLLYGGLAVVSCGHKAPDSATAPFTLDHNRMLVDAEIQRADGTWRKVRLWVDTGNPDFFMTEALARDLGIDLSELSQRDSTKAAQPLTVPPPTAARLGDLALDFQGVKCQVMFSMKFLFGATGADANLPATVLKKYHVVFDYPGRELTLAARGSLTPRGTRVAAAVNRETGIVQIDVAVGGENVSFALDNGASYSFLSADVYDRLALSHAEWPRTTGAVGCANMWGWWPDEPNWPVMRVPEIRCGDLTLEQVGIVGLPSFFGGGASLGDWYSRKTAKPVVGFLGPNAFKAYRVEFDYAKSAVYFEKGADVDTHDMDVVGLTLGQDNEGSWLVVGVKQKDGAPAVEHAEPGDKLVRVGTLEVTGLTMGKVVDALRGQPGDTRTLVLDRNGRQITTTAPVYRWL